MVSHRKSKLRSLLIGFIYIGLLGGLLIRLIWLQTVDASHLQAQAEKAWQKNEMIKPERGTIMDRNEKELAQEVSAYIIAADLNQLEHPKQAAKQLAPIMDMPEKTIRERLLKKGVRQVEIRNGGHYKVSEKQRQQIMRLGIPGIYAIRTTDRDYIEGELAAHVLGFVNAEGQPTGGVEQRYNRKLQGKEGKIRYKKDAQGRKLYHGVEDFTPPVQGKDVVLTLDGRIQYQAEKVLDQVMKQYQPKAATAVVADPQTGGILAMANRPTFDPGNYGSTWKSGANDKNMAISSQFEPGSTFKIVTLAAAIEEKLFQGDAFFQSGAIKVAGRKIRDWNDTGWGEITYRKGVELSSNVAFVKLGRQLGADKLIRYIDRFGFGRITERTGQKTGIDLPAEAKGYFFGKEELSPLELASTAFGQGIAVTPIQQVMAVSAIANGGTLYRPHVLKEIRDPDTGKVLQKEKPYAIRKRVVSPQTAAQVRDILRGVVKEGTGKEADIPGFEVAGKTGTAQKPLAGGKGYAKGEYIVSFIGFAPADHPRAVVYVAVDDPAGSPHGGEVAAPAARDILREVLRVKGVNPSSSPVQNETAGNESPLAQDWRGQGVDQVNERLSNQGLNVNVLGGGDKVIAQYPAPDKPVYDRRVYLLTEDSRAMNMPDLYGKSLREALDICSLLGLQVDVEGEGYVVGQSIPPDERILDRQTIQLILHPEPDS
ncbi:stage V sporulation protein D [Marinithermofilum abyssi]|uniref:Stage V sporulation protein D n=1 Tax=Marinithermofilum abyssi TaxID=1571185 RepID=A0A8J2VIU3_9BACL|nr:PASTA domain-containing penicillin-binding protein [Marinithermofilum abyssi]GGE22587.1 stage V sporulation protein D [Marinithermofilum abyssi]